MTSLSNGMWSNHWKRKMQHSFYFIAVCIACVQHSVLCCANCKLTLTAPSGHFTSPCYPEQYPNSQDCKWTIRAPVGFIIQVIFIDFDVEEAQNCMYDSLSIYNGETTSKFCGITAKGLSFNSTGNEMMISFSSDFSIQKKGFSVTYTQVAVSLRNQKVTVSQNQTLGLVSVSSKISIPALTQLTVCFEATKTDNSTENWKVFSYQSSSMDLLSFGKNTTGHVLTIMDVPCILDSALLTPERKEFFTASFQQLCIIWTNHSEQIFVRTKNNYQAVSCPDAKDLTIPGGGNFILGSYGSKAGPLQGDVYNLRLWDTAMDSSVLANLSCDVKGNIINWENDFWSIPSWARKTENNLSCGTSLPTTPSTEPTTCEKLAGVCQGGTFYRISITVVTDDLNDESKVQSMVSSWLNITFRNWNYTVFVVNMSVHIADGRHSRDLQAVINNSMQKSHARLSREVVNRNQSFYIWALLVYNNSNNVALEKNEILKKINEGPGPDGLKLQAVDVFPVELCPAEETPTSYHWPATRPRETQIIPCLKSSVYTASRTCFLHQHHYTSFWGEPDLKDCTDNAEDLANQLLNLTASGQELTQEKVDDVVKTLKKIVNGADINADLGSTVVNVFSNILNSSDSVLAKSSSQ